MLFSFLIHQESKPIQPLYESITHRVVIKRKKLSAKRLSLLKEAKKHIGARYKYAGTTPAGFDCSGFASYVYNKLGIKIGRSSTDLSKYGKKVKKRAIKPGDLVFFGSGSRINHVGIVTSVDNDGLKMIHSSSSKGVRIDNISTSKYWSKRFLFAKSLL